METKVVAKYIRSSPQKARLVADLIRGKRVDEALSLLQHVQKKPVRYFRTLIQSAVSNAENLYEVKDPDEFLVKEVWVNAGPTLKRFMARALGRATRIRKRTCHLTVVLDIGDAKEKKASA